MSISCPDERIDFPNDATIELNYRDTQTYSRCRSYDTKAMTMGYVWHQIIVHHKGKLRGGGGDDTTREILDAVFEAVQGEEFYPIAYRRGSMSDRFLVRQCRAALDKLFAENLTIQLSNRVFITLQVQLNVGSYVIGQISPYTKIAQALNACFNNLETVNGENGILNLSNFANHREFQNMTVNLGNRAVFERICDLIYRNDDKFRSLNGIVLSRNNIRNLEPLQVFNGVEFGVLDLRENQLSSPTRLCRELKDLKATELLLNGNPVTKSASYPECLKPVLKNFKLIDGIPVANLSKDYTPLDTNMDMGSDGYRIDPANKDEIDKFQQSDDWHAIMIPDPQEEFSKEEIFDYFFITVSPDFSDIYPCYYQFSNEEHQFLVRKCFDQLKHLLYTCNFEIKVPRLCASTEILSDIDDLTSRVQIEKSIPYYVRMSISPFKAGQIDPMECIDKALTRRYSAMDRLLNLENFQAIEGLEKIIFHLSCTRILGRVLMQASRKYLNNCVELRLSHNKILSVNFPKVLALMQNLKAIDLGNNWIHDLKDVKELYVLGLKSLRLDGNPLCAKYISANEYVKSVVAVFPDLKKLDNVEISKKGSLSSQKNFLCNVEGYDFVDKFVTLYFKTFESDNRASLAGFYHPNSLFTMTCNYTAAQLTSQNFKRIARYVEHSRDIYKMEKFSRAFTSIHYGRNRIVQVLMSLPNIAHDMLSFTTDSTIFMDDLVVITVSGVFLDQADDVLTNDIPMAFCRTFVLMPVERNTGILKCGVCYQIVNEQLSVYNPTPTQMQNAFKYSKGKGTDKRDEAKVTVADKEPMLILFQEVTNLKSIWCTRCLEDANWDFEEALKVFLALCDKKEIPPTAFI